MLSPLLCTCMSSLGKSLLSAIIHFLIRLFWFFYWVVRILYVFWILTSYQMYDLQYFLLFHRLLFIWLIFFLFLCRNVIPWCGSVQFNRSVVSDSLWPHESQHARPPCLSPSPGVHSDSCPSSLWCHPAISSLVVPSPPAPNPCQHQSLFQWVNSSHEVAKVLEFQL